MTFLILWFIRCSIPTIIPETEEEKYTNDPIMPPKEPTELCNAMPTARFVGDPRILFEFQAIVIAIPGKAPIAARNVPAYLAPTLFVTYNTTNPIAATK